VVTADDPDASSGSSSHWLLYDLPGHRKGLPAGIPRRERLPSGARQGVGDGGKIGYDPPCAPAGKTHHYWFRVYALEVPTGLGPRAKSEDVLRAIRGRALGVAELMGTHAR
jgi:Raf kinase inhibitor-like YbhB/YbcL family protein